MTCMWLKFMLSFLTDGDVKLGLQGGFQADWVGVCAQAIEAISGCQPLIAGST